MFEEQARNSWFGCDTYVGWMSETNDDLKQSTSEAPVGSIRVFATTHWSVVLTAGQIDTPEATKAIERLCQTYWYPIYAHVRRRGSSQHDAEDLTQGFFTHLIKHELFGRASREKGRFRSFLLASVNNFLSDEWDRATAWKRGGRSDIVSFDAEIAENRFRSEPSDGVAPDKIFDREWVRSLLDRVLDRLANEFTKSGKERQFGRLSCFLIENRGSGTYAEAASDLDQTEEAIKKAVQRMRRRYGDLFREEIAQTVTTPEEVEEELRYLRSVLAS